MTPIEQICNLPVAFHAGDKSPLQLVCDSGIEDEPGSLAATSIANILLANPTLVESWLRWSEDKRVSSGWYFLRENNGYLVGFIPEGERLFFKDAFTACSEFIVREVDGMLQSLRSNPALKRDCRKSAAAP